MYFQIVPASGGYRVHIKDANHRLIFWTEVYVSQAGARHAAQLVKAHAGAAPIYGA